MSHHVSASPSNPTGAVEVVRVSNSSTTAAPVDAGSSAGAGAPAATQAASTPPVSTVVGGQPTAGGQSGLAGANLPVEDIQQASNTIQSAQADLSRTAGAERRLDGFDLVGGDGGGGGGDAGQENANNAEGAVAQGTADQDVSETGIGGDRMEVGQSAEITTTAEQGGGVADQPGNSAVAADQSGNANLLPDMDERSLEATAGSGTSSTSTSTSA